MRRGGGDVGVMLVPARTDTRWFHEYIYGKAEIRFIKGRLKFSGSKDSAPFPSMIVVFRKGRTMMSNGKYIWIVNTEKIENDNHLLCFDNIQSAVECSNYYKKQYPDDAVTVEKVPLYVYFDYTHREYEENEILV